MDSHTQLDCKLTYGNKIKHSLHSRTMYSSVFKNKTEQKRNDEKYSQTMGRNTRRSRVFLPTLLSCSSRFLRALQQKKAQTRLLYLLNIYIYIYIYTHLHVFQILQNSCQNMNCNGYCSIMYKSFEFHEWV